MVELRDQVISVADVATIGAEELDRQLETFLDSCPGDTLVLIDQPGVSSEDFKPGMATAALWTQFARYFNRCGTFRAYMQTPVQLDMDAIAQRYVARCGAEVIEPDLARQNVEKRLFGHYVDTKRRVIKVRFPALALQPDDEDDDAYGGRQDELFANDLVLHDIIKGTPSPFFSIIYTNSAGANTSATPAGHYTDYHVIRELVQASQDPTNRDAWKKHGPGLDPGSSQYLGNLGAVKPPLVQHQRSQEAQQAALAAAARKEARLARGGVVDVVVHNVNQMVTVSFVLVVAAVFGAGLFMLGMVRLGLRLVGVGSGPEAEAETKEAETKEPEPEPDNALNAEFHVSAYGDGDMSVSSAESTVEDGDDEPDDKSTGLRRRKI